MDNQQNIILPPDSPTPVRRLPRVCIVLFALAGVSLLIYLAAIIWEPFADFFSRYPGAVLRATLAHLTSWIPFSLAEALLLFLPAALFLLIRNFLSLRIVRKAEKNLRRFGVDAPGPILFRSTFEELETLGKLKDKEAFEEFRKERSQCELRWAIINSRFFDK